MYSATKKVDQHAIAITPASGRIGDMPRAWGMKQDRKTPGYTTEWADMPVVKA